MCSKSNTKYFNKGDVIMAKTKKASGKKKDCVKALIQLGETVTKMASRNDELMTIAGINTFTKNAESIDSIENLENIIGMEPPKETLWCRTIDVSNGNIMNDSCNTVVVLSNDRATVDGVAMILNKANTIMKDDVPVLIPDKLFDTYSKFVHDTRELIERTHKIPKPEKIEVDIYSVLAYMFLPFMNISDEIHDKIMKPTLSITKIRTELSVSCCGNYLFIDLDECVLELGVYNSAKKYTTSYQYTKERITNIVKNIYTKQQQTENNTENIVSVKVHIPIYRIEKYKRIRIGYMMVSADSDTVVLFNNGDSNFVVENYMAGNSDSFRITDFALNVSSYTTARGKHLYMPLGCIILNENEHGDTGTVQKIIRDVSRNWYSLL